MAKEYSIKNTIKAEEQLKNDKQFFVFFLGMAALSGIACAANIEPTKTNEIFNALLNTSREYVGSLDNIKHAVHYAFFSGVNLTLAASRYSDMRENKRLVKTLSPSTK